MKHASSDSPVALERRLTILSWPARSNARDNSFTQRLSDAVESAGAAVHEFSVREALRGQYDVLHVHWPEGVLKRTGPITGLARATAVIGTLFWARFVRRRPTVWTVHNLAPHDMNRPKTVALLRWGLGVGISGYIHLSTASLAPLSELIPRSRNRPQVVIPHGRYDGEFVPTESREQTRAALGAAADDLLVVYAGRVERYKGALELVEAAASSRNTQLRLALLGASSDSAYATEIRVAADADSRIIVRDERLESSDLANAIAAADLVVYPYRAILNSGSVLPPLEFDTRVLAPAVGSIPEMSARVGADWLQTYVPPLDAAMLDLALSAPRPSAAPRLGSLEWSAIAADTIEFYERLWGEKTRGESK